MKKIIITAAIIQIFSVMLFSQSENTPSEIKLNDLAYSFLDETISYPFSFVVIGDAHPKKEDPPPYTYNTVFSGMLDAIALKQPKFIICCGDLTNHGRIDESTGDLGNFQAFDDAVRPWMESTQIPFFSLPGNHDFDNGHDNYRNIVGNDLNYYFDYGNSRFILINSVQQPGETDYSISDETISNIGNWLEEAPVNRFTFAHVPMSQISYKSNGASDVTGITEDPVPNYNLYHRLNRDYGVRASFSGHQHRYEHDHFTECDGVDYYISGGATGHGFNSIITDPSLERFAKNHYLLVTVTSCNDYQVDVFVYDRETGEFDPDEVFDNNATSNQFKTEENLSEFVGINNWAYNLYLDNGTINEFPVFYVAGNLIKLSNDFNIAGDGIVTMVAKNKILMEPDFGVAKGSYFKAYLDESLEINCNSDLKPIIPESYDENEKINTINSDPENKLYEFIKIVPNPFDNSFDIVLSADLNADKFEIIDISGRIVHSEKYVELAGKTVNTSDLSPGIYFVRVYTNRRVQFKKIIKQ